MLFWESSQLDVVRSAVEAARSGQPTVLVLEGEAGAGKTSLLAELGSLATGFRILAAEGVENDLTPGGVLAQWGVEPAGNIPAGMTGAFLAAQGLRKVIDASAKSGPVLLRVDDLQWADPESVEALTWLVRRTLGDRLLVAIGTRPLPSQAHSSWQRWANAPDHAVRIPLAGLPFPAATALIRQHWPLVSIGSARQLWEHTSGNPLFLTALLQEYGASSLLRMRVMPAPADFARVLGARLDRLSPASVALMRAVAVLGTGWVSLFDAAEVARVADPTQAAGELVDAGMLQGSVVDGGASMRVSHALVRAAIYQQIPMQQRRTLHAAAAAVAVKPSVVLEHRLAAADQYDDVLADDLEQFSRSLYDDQSYRLAAQYLRWASGVTRTPRERQRRWLESLFDSVLARDFGAVRAELPDVLDSQDIARSALIQGALANLEGRWLEGVRTLSPISTDPALGDPLTRHRIEVFLATTRIGAGEPAEMTLAGLERATSSGVQDPAMSVHIMFASGQALGYVHGPEAVLAGVAELPAAPAAVPPELSYVLGWRGTLRVTLGFLSEAKADLYETHQRIVRGITDPGDGLFYNVLGTTHWFSGEWDRAQVYYRLVRDVAQDSPAPLLLTFPTLAAIGVGDFAEADKTLAWADALLTEMPWPAGVQSLRLTSVARLHAGGTDAAKALWLRETQRRWPNTPLHAGLVGPLHLMHIALAAIWARELILADELVVRIKQFTARPPWLEPVVEWLRGLIAEASGQPKTALRYLQGAVDAQNHELPLYLAHMHFDLARIAALVGNADSAKISAERAADIYRRLGATPYVERTNQLGGLAAPAAAVAALPLTERERDVLTLLVTGLSYAQISRDLFITRSTVSYHLTNLYAKAGVASRHALTRLVHGQSSVVRAGCRAFLIRPFAGCGSQSCLSR